MKYFFQTVEGCGMQKWPSIWLVGVVDKNIITICDVLAGITYIQWLSDAMNNADKVTKKALVPKISPAGPDTANTTTI